MTQIKVKTLKNYVGGEWEEAKSDKTEEVYSPATGEVIAHVPISSQEDVHNAVKVAAKAVQE